MSQNRSFVVWICRFAFRLVFYVDAVLYVTGHTSMIVAPRGPFYIFFNVMLLALYVMNVYWFQFIVLAAVRILSGNVVKDTREESEDDESATESDSAPLAEGNVKKLNGRKDDADEHTQMGLQRLLKLPDNTVPPEFSEGDSSMGADLNDLPPGKSASQTANKRLRRRQP